MLLVGGIQTDPLPNVRAWYPASAAPADGHTQGASGRQPLLEWLHRSGYAFPAAADDLQRRWVARETAPRSLGPAILGGPLASTLRFGRTSWFGSPE